MQERARTSKAAILARPEPDSRSYAMGTGLGRNSYLATLLPESETKECLEALMTIAADGREAASNRQDALTGARNMVIGQSSEVRDETFTLAEAFATGAKDGSALDDFTGTPHPLSFFKVSMGSRSLRGHGLKLAHAAADSRVQHDWVREQSVSMLRSTEAGDVAAAALTLTRLPPEVTAVIDAGLLASSENTMVRQAAALLAAREPDRYRNVLLRLCAEPDHRVRVLIAESIAAAESPVPAALLEARDLLEQDPRHSVRSALVPPMSPHGA